MWHALATREAHDVKLIAELLDKPDQAVDIAFAGLRPGNAVLTIQSTAKI
jgi:hypothetical protein